MPQRQWTIEYEGEPVGRLTRPSLDDMFWVEYQIEPNEGYGQLLASIESREFDDFRFRDSTSLEFAEYAVPTRLQETLPAKKVILRGLYTKSDLQS